jgi:hypothetical protein
MSRPRRIEVRIKRNNILMRNYSRYVYCFECKNGGGRIIQTDNRKGTYALQK